MEPCEVAQDKRCTLGMSTEYAGHITHIQLRLRALLDDCSVFFHVIIVA